MVIDPARAALTSPLVPLAEAAARAVETPPRSVVLVEGLSDQFAVEALAVRRGLDLAADAVLVTPMQGATNLRRFLEVFGPPGLGLRIFVLSDEREADDMRRRLRDSGVPESVLYVCVADLEDELIRALGPSRVQDIVADAGDLRAFQSLQRQPEWRGRPQADQLRRFFGSGSGRKIRYGALLAAETDPQALTGPLDDLMRALGLRPPASSTG